MTASLLVNRAGMDTSTTGTGTLTLGSALGAVAPNVCSFLSFAGAGVADTNQVSYLILDSNGAWEVGFGVYTSSGTTLTRNVTKSSNSNNAINLSGSAQVFVTARSNDLLSSNDATVTANVAYRASSTTGRIIQPSALVIADTTASLSRDGNGGIPLQGTNTNDSAASGFVGEYIESVIAQGSAVSLTNATNANVTNISLTAGDWDVSANINFLPGATTNTTVMIAGANTSSASLPAATSTARWANTAGKVMGGFQQTETPPVVRMSLSGTTTVYLVAYSEFTISTSTAFGMISARRVR